MKIKKIKHLFSKYKVPELVIRESRSSEETTMAAHARLDRNGIIKWESFQEEMDRCSLQYDPNALLSKVFTPYFSLVASNEAEVVGEFSTHVKAPFLLILNSLVHNVTLGSPCGLKSVVLDPNLVMLDKDLNPKFVVEFKSPWEFPIDPSLDIGLCIAKETNLNTKKVTNAVAQLYGYLSFNCLKYGILTNYDFYIFFCRSSERDSKLTYSAPIPKSQILKYLVNFFFLPRSSPFYTCPLASPIESLEPFEGIGTAHRLVPIGPQSFRFLKPLGYTNHGGIVRGNLGGLGSETVVFKVKNICRDHQIAQSLQMEAEKFHSLKQIQGIAIPQFFGHVDFDGVFHAIVMEDCGEQLPDCDSAEDTSILRDPEVKRNAICALYAIHREGFLHGDIEARNICIERRSKKVRVLDFGLTVKCDDSNRFQKEMKELEQLFII